MTMKKHIYSFIIVAGGSGTRLGGVPKQFRKLGNIPVWLWSCRTALKLLGDTLCDIVLVLPQAYLNSCIDECKRLGLNIKCVAGGSERALSVKAGLLAANGDYALIHDAARPFLTTDLILRLLDAADKYENVIPLLPSSDALKQIENNIIQIVDRSKIYRTQTPQLVNKNMLLELLDKNPTIKDEAEAILAAGNSVGYVVGDEINFKITDEFDWQVANKLVENCESRITRVGYGYDIHRLVKGRKLILAGLEIPFDLGLLGHSDADLVTHAICDALLGAAGLPDIGTLFPASDPIYKDINSIELLKICIKRILRDGWSIEWIDSVLTTQVPRLGSLIPQMVDNINYIILAELQKNVAATLDSTKFFNLKVKSGEEAGSVGRCECMICHAVATLYRLNEDKVISKI